MAYKVKDIIVRFVQIVLMILMFYFRDGSITIGGFGFMYCYLLGIGIIALAIIDFLIDPKVLRVVTLVKGSAIYQLPYAIPILVQMALWTYQFAAVQTMTRGLFYIVYQVLSVVTACAVLMIFGKNGIWAWLGTLAFANFITLLETVAEFGPATVIQEWVTLMVTFGNNTGLQMRAMEIHNTVFAYGPFVLVQLLWHKRISKAWLMFIVQTFFFLLGLKRIAVAGVIAAYIVCFVAEHIKNDRVAKTFISVVNWCIIIGTFGYIYLINQGLFDFLEEMGLDTKGRDILYQFINKQYEYQPFFFGRGLGFSQTPWEQTGRWSQQVHQDAFHNDFLKMFVEIGCIPYLLWVYTHIEYRAMKFIKYGKKVGTIFFATMLYMTVNYLTDNTFYYFYVTGQTCIVVLWAMLNYTNDEDKRLSELSKQYENNKIDSGCQSECLVEGKTQTAS